MSGREEQGSIRLQDQAARSTPCGQWPKGTQYPYELTIVSNAGAPGVGIEVQDKVQSLV
jgi:hypothetical protein